MCVCVAAVVTSSPVIIIFALDPYATAAALERANEKRGESYYIYEDKVQAKYFLFSFIVHNSVAVHSFRCLTFFLILL
jgi:hypothetical protein